MNTTSQPTTTPIGIVTGRKTKNYFFRGIWHFRLWGGEREYKFRGPGQRLYHPWNHFATPVQWRMQVARILVNNSEFKKKQNFGFGRLLNVQDDSHVESLKQSCKNNLSKSRMVVGCRHWVWHRENSSRCLIMHFHLLTLKLHANWVLLMSMFIEIIHNRNIMHSTLSLHWQGGVINAFWWRAIAHIQRWSPQKM